MRKIDFRFFASNCDNDLNSSTIANLDLQGKIFFQSCDFEVVSCKTPKCFMSNNNQIAKTLYIIVAKRVGCVYNNNLLFF